MISNKDIYITAKTMIKTYGDVAEERAVQMMYECMEEEDVKGASIWLGIIAAIADLQTVNKQEYLH